MESNRRSKKNESIRNRDIHKNHETRYETVNDKGSILDETIEREPRGRRRTLIVSVTRFDAARRRSRCRGL